jgi:hypothetical protein
VTIKQSVVGWLTAINNLNTSRPEFANYSILKPAIYGGRSAMMGELWLDDLHVGHRFRTDVYDLAADDIIEFATRQILDSCRHGCGTG